MSPCQQILERYCTAARYTRQYPNMLIINPGFELRVLADIEKDDKLLPIYRTLRVVHSNDVDDFELASVYGLESP